MNIKSILRKIYYYLFITIIFLSPYFLTPKGYCQENKKITDPIKIHATEKNKEYLKIYFKKEDKPYQEILLIRIIFDINNDGLNDIAIGNSFEEGKAGVNWDIYLGQKDGTYKFLTNMLFHPLAFFIKPINKNRTEFYTYIRMGGMEGYLDKNIIIGDTIKEEKNELIYPTTKPEDEKLYKELFESNNNPYPENCYLHEYIEKGSCKWESGYYREEKR